MRRKNHETQDSKYQKRRFFMLITPLLPLNGYEEHITDVLPQLPRSITQPNFCRRFLALAKLS